MGGVIKDELPSGVTLEMVLESKLRTVTAERDELKRTLVRISTILHKPEKGIWERIRKELENVKTLNQPHTDEFINRMRAAIDAARKG